MQTISRYLFKQVFIATLVLNFFLLAIFLLIQSLRFLDYLISKGISLKLFFQLSLLLLPSFASKILPVAFFIASLLVFARLYTDRELIVIRTLGFSNFKIISSIIYAATIFLTIMYFINSYLMPLATRNFGLIKTSITNNLSGRWIQPSAFNNFNNITFYTKSKTRSGNMQNILVYDKRTQQNPVTVTAEKGKIIEKPEGLNLVLFNGTHQSFDKKLNKTTMIEFDQYNLYIASESKLHRIRKPNELSLSELLNSNNKGNNDQLITIEKHERILFPLIIYLFALAIGVIFLTGDYQRKHKYKKITYAILFMIMLQILTMVLFNLANKYWGTIPICYSIYILIFGSLLFLLNAKKI